ncbi:MAG: DoxX-like family protein [Bacteroidota bacterium]
MSYSFKALTLFCNKRFNQVGGLRRAIVFFAAAVWMGNGLYCKILNRVPRHQQIVGRILNVDGHNASLITLLIGFLEVLMAVWILIGIQRRFNVIIQIVIIGMMNILEFILASDLLLWGKLNALFAGLFILMIFINEFYQPQSTLEAN